jgi:hypothetical protein
MTMFKMCGILATNVNSAFWGVVTPGTPTNKLMVRESSDLVLQELAVHSED